jgi:hypothetical protein
MIYEYAALAVTGMTGFFLGWSLRAALARSDMMVKITRPEFDRFPKTMILEPEEIIDLKPAIHFTMNGQNPSNANSAFALTVAKERFRGRGDRS